MPGADDTQHQVQWNSSRYRHMLFAPLSLALQAGHDPLHVLRLVLYDSKC